MAHHQELFRGRHPHTTKSSTPQDLSVLPAYGHACDMRMRWRSRDAGELTPSNLVYSGYCYFCQLTQSCQSAIFECRSCLEDWTLVCD